MSEKIKVGVFGLSRGMGYAHLINENSEGTFEVVALCDKREDRLTDGVKSIPGVVGFSDFDKFMAWGKENGMQIIFLANYFHQHTPFAIKCMENGFDVVSECIPCVTMAECVQLCRCVEKTGRKYMFGENYPFMPGNLELKRVIKEGTLGSVMYLEAEYNHHDPAQDLLARSRGKYHWRRWEPRPYYITHTLAPLMYFLDAMPKYVSAMVSYSQFADEEYTFRAITDGMAQVMCEFDNGSIGRFSGCNGLAAGYSCYRAFGDRGSCEWGGLVEGGKMRLNYKSFTCPEGVPDCQTYAIDFDKLDPRVKIGQQAGHSGSDFMVVQNMVDAWRDNKPIYFDVYKAAAISACAALGLRSCLNHGTSYAIPDFKNEAERKVWENDTLCPFPDENGEGMTIKPGVGYRPGFLEKCQASDEEALS